MAHDYHEMSTPRPIWFFTNYIEQNAQIGKLLGYLQDLSLKVLTVMLHNNGH